MFLAFVTPSVSGSILSYNKPSSDYFVYRTASGGPAVVSNTYLGSDAQSALTAEVYSFTRNVAGSGLDEYALRIGASASTRVAHIYNIQYYQSEFDDCTYGGGQYCADSGLTGLNQGKWFDFGWTVYYWGQVYHQIFICSNGWASFSYSGDVNNCPKDPQTLPTPESLDSNGNRIPLPFGIIAPLWKPLQVTVQQPYVSGKIMLDLSPPIVRANHYTRQAGAGFGVTWLNVATAGTNSNYSPCYGEPCTNSFSFMFDDVGDLALGYPSGAVNPKDPYNGQETIGLEDPAGYGAVNPDRSSSLSNGGVLLQDPASDTRDVIPYGHIVDTQIVLKDPSTTDNAQGVWDTGLTYTFNLRTTNPPPPPDNPAADLLAQEAEWGIKQSICLTTGGLMCALIDQGGIVSSYWIKVQKQLQLSLNPTHTDMAGSQTQGLLKNPAHDESQLCGIPSANPPSGDIHDCASDTSEFTVVHWRVPPDSAFHDLTIQFGITLASAYCCPLSGSPVRWTTVQLSVSPQDFSISASPSNFGTINVGTSFTSTISINGLNGFPASIPVNVAASVPTGLTCSLSSNQIYATVSPYNTATLNCTANSPGPYTVSVKGTWGNYGELTHTATVTVNVVSPDFNISPSPSSINVYQGAPGTSTITVGSLNTFSGNVVLSADAPAGFSAAFNPTTVSLSSGGTATSTLTISVSGNPNAGPYQVTVTGSSGSLSHPATISVSYPGDFSVSPSSPLTFSCPFITGSTCGTSVPTVSSLNGFSGAVALTANPSPGLSATLSPSSLSVSPSATSATANLGVSAVSAGTYTLTVTGTSGPLTHTTATMTFMFYDFSLSLNCGSPGCSYALTPGYPVQDTLTVTSLGGFSGTVNLSYSSGGQTVSLSSSSVTLSSGGQASVTVSITGGSSSGTVSVTGTCASGPCISPPQSHSASVYIGISCGCGGGGSVAAGTLITLVDGTRVPVQSLKVGMELLSYDMATHHFVITTITRFVTVMTHNQMVISTSTGKPLIVDQNPAQKLYVKMPDGTVTLMSVTDLKVGYGLFDAISQTWVPITNIHYQIGGNHLMYDIYTTAPGNYIANGYLDPYKT